MMLKNSYATVSFFKLHLQENIALLNSYLTMSTLKYWISKLCVVKGLVCEVWTNFVCDPKLTNLII